MSAFSAFAPYYDLLYQERDYLTEARQIAQQFQRYTDGFVSPGPPRVLDLGCGTGSQALALTRVGYEVCGIDNSPDMVSRALAKGVTARMADVRSFRALADEGALYDLVMSWFHVASYQTTLEDLEALFATAHAHLKPQGLWMFDFWYGPAVLTQPPGVRAKSVSDPDWHLTRIAVPTLNARDNRVMIDYQLFVESRHTQQIGRLAESHTLRYWFLPELRERLYGNGFGLLEASVSLDRYDGKIVARRL